MNDNITATLNRHFSDSLYLCLSLLEISFLFLFFCFFLFLSALCGYADSQFERTGGFFSAMFYSAACQVVTTMGLALLPSGMLWACCFSSSCLSVSLAVCSVSSHSTDCEGDLTLPISICLNCRPVKLVLPTG